MGIYIFPIFLFGCAITGIVLMAVQQAADWAKDEAAQKMHPELGFKNIEPVHSRPNSGPPDHRSD